MKLRFLHAADIHLGYEQYNLPKRADDFAKAFYGLVDYACEVKPDFVLIAGDLFHHANPDAWALKQAMKGLTDLRRAGIPALAIEGNHDTTYARKHLSWMSFLCEEEYLTLLNVSRSANGLYSLVAFDNQERLGSYIDIAGARIYGIKYHGAATARVLEEVRDDIEPGPGGYTILMLHAGMEGQIPHLHGGLTEGQIAPLREQDVDYLALGHIHKRLMKDDWVYNPGSTETNSFEEMDWPHGFFDVAVDTDQDPKHEVREIKTEDLRPFKRISAVADGVEKLEEFVAIAEARIGDAKSIPEQAVIELSLGGVAGFRRQDVPVERLKGAIETKYRPLTVRVRNGLVPPGLVSVRHGERMSRAELERQVIEQLIYSMADYRDRAAAWSKLMIEVKDMAVEKNLPADIVEHVRTFLSRQDADEAAAPTLGGNSCA